MSSVSCDYCEEGNVAVDGWHLYVDDVSEMGGNYRVPCAIDPPKT